MMSKLLGQFSLNYSSHLNTFLNTINQVPMRPHICLTVQLTPQILLEDPTAADVILGLEINQETADLVDKD